MVEVYYYLPSDKVSNVVECGMKLSQWFDREVAIGSEKRKCISALLNPKDDIGKYRSAGYKCVKLELSPDYCFVADKYLYLAGVDFPEVMKLYTGSVIPIETYTFGSYRLPECLVTSTVISGQISVLDKRRDSPVLFDNSEELYINNIIEAYKEEHRDFYDTVLYFFYNKFAEKGKLYKIEDNSEKIAIFIDKDTGKTFTIKIPDISNYGLPGGSL